MSKFIKRLGTSASKFMVEVYLHKVELNLIQPCRITITVKRGDHVAESKNAIALEKCVAVFDEKVVIPATLYYEKKKGTYIAKEASLSINVITPKVTRLAGVAKIDLAHYPNNNLTEEDVVKNVDKCFDKNAKIHFKIRMIKINDIIPERKSRKKEKDSKNTRDKSQASELSVDTSEKRDRSGSPFTSQMNGEGSELPDFTDNSSIPDLSKIDVKSQTSQFEFGRGKSPDFKIDDSSDGEMFADKSRSRTVDITRTLGRKSISNGKAASKSRFNDTESEIGAINDMLTVPGNPQKVLELEVKVKNYQRENKELYDKIREDNEEYLNLNQELEDLKLKYDRLHKEHENLLNNKSSDRGGGFGLDKKGDADSKSLKDKVSKLERELDEVKRERDEANERADELQEATNDLLAKIETLKGKQKNSSKISAGESEKIEEYIAKVSDLNQKLKEAEKKVRELSDPDKADATKLNVELEELEIENNMFKKNITEKDQKIEELEKQISIQKEEIKLIKMSSSKGRDNDGQQVMSQIEQMEKKQKSLEDTYKKRIEELTKQNSELKKQLDHSKNAINTSQFDTENELAKLGIENENLKRQVKELSTKSTNVKHDSREADDLRKKIGRLEVEKEKVEAELVKIKMGWASVEMERDDLKSKLKKREDNTKGSDEKLQVLEKDVFKLRNRIAELMNAIMDYGDDQLLDEVENIITEDKGNGDDDKELTYSRY